MTYHSPFDLYYYFVNVFAGNMTMFLTISFAFIAFMTAMFRMPILVTGVMFSIFIVMLGVVSGNLYILVLLIIALVIGWLFTRLFK